jgi:hypothetical protein
LALAAFRFIRKAAAAVAAMVVVYSLLSRVLSLFLGGIQFENVIWIALWVCILFGGLALALRWVKPVWLALVAGAMASDLVRRVCIFILDSVRERAWRVGADVAVRFVPFGLMETAILAGVLWAGLRLSSDQPSEAGVAEPRLRKGFFRSTLAVAFGLPTVLSFAVIILTMTRVWGAQDSTPSLILLAMAGLLLIYGIVVMCVLVYRMWAAIQDGHARTSPGRALGCLFIPFFNFYWAFQAFRGFAKDFNAFVSRHSLKAPRLSPGLLTAYAVLTVGAVVPVLGLLLTVANYFVLLVMVSRVCDAVNCVPRILPAAASTLGA